LTEEVATASEAGPADSDGVQTYTGDAAGLWQAADEVARRREEKESQFPCNSRDFGAHRAGGYRRNFAQW